ncbi:MAG: hypothetical protein WKF37_06175 [Bryobacteraceae bacterium]
MYADARDQAGIVLGTASYVAPDHARGKPWTNADVWASGSYTFRLALVELPRRNRIAGPAART